MCNQIGATSDAASKSKQNTRVMCREQLKKSIKEKLFVLPKETMVLPGSGSFTSIATEALYNPEVGEKTKPSRVCSTNRPKGLRLHLLLLLAATDRREQLSPDLGRDLVVVVLLQQRLQRLLLLRRQLRLVSLREGQQALRLTTPRRTHLLPQHGQLALVVHEAQKVRHQRIDHHVRQGVLLVQQHRHEQRRRARVPVRHASLTPSRQLRQLHQRRRRVRHWDRHLRHDRADDHRLLQRAFVLRFTRRRHTHLAQRDHDALEERRRLVHRLLQRLVQVVVQLPTPHSRGDRALVAVDVVQHGGQQHRGVEALRQLRVQVGGEDARGGEGGLRRPLVRLRDPQNLGVRGVGKRDLFPVAERGNDLEGLGQLAGAVATGKCDARELLLEDLAHGGVHLDDLGVQRLLGGLLHLALLLDLLHNQVGEVALLAVVGGEEELQCGLSVKSNG